MTATTGFHENTVAAILALQRLCFAHSVNSNHVATSEAAIIDFDHSCATMEVFFNPTVHKLRFSSQIRTKFSNIFTPYSE